MNRMADTVIKDQDAKAHEEEMKIRKWEEQKEIKARMEEDRKVRRLKEYNE